jgi:endonuclease YncB( thermonuclease family)
MTACGNYIRLIGGRKSHRLLYGRQPTTIDEIAISRVKNNSDDGAPLPNLAVYERHYDNDLPLSGFKPSARSIPHMIRSSALLFLLMFATACTTQRVASPHVPLAPYAAVSVRTINGDTLILRNTRNQNIETVRLAGLAAPDAGQAFSADAAYKLQKLVDGSPLVISAVGHDDNNQLLVYVCLSDKPFFSDWKYPPCDPNDSVNFAMVRSGLAWVDTRQSAQPALSGAESLAQEDRVGLWQQLAPIPPWQWTLLSPQKQFGIRQAEQENQSRRAAVSGGSSPSWTGMAAEQPAPRSGSDPSPASTGVSDEQAAYYWLFRGIASGVDPATTQGTD